MKQRVVSAMLMGLITTGIVSFVLLGVNRGFSPGFWWAWLKSWTIAYGVVVPVVLGLSPKVQRLAGYLCRQRPKVMQEKQNQERGAPSVGRCACTPTDTAGYPKAKPASGGHPAACPC